MSSDQSEPRRFALRDLTRAETTAAFLGMGQMLKQAMMRISPDEDFMSLKADLIRDAKSVELSGGDIRNEIAVMDTLIDLIEMAFARAEKARKAQVGRVARPGPIQRPDTAR